MRLPTKCRQNFLRIHEYDCLQHCKMLSADFSRLIVLTVYGLVPFIVSFHDLRLLLQRGDLMFIMLSAKSVIRLAM